MLQCARLRVFRNVGFFRFGARRSKATRISIASLTSDVERGFRHLLLSRVRQVQLEVICEMDSSQLTLAQQIAATASLFQEQRTGHAPTSATVVLSEDTLVITLHEALTPAEKALAQTPLGAKQVQEFHRGLFNDSFVSLRKEIERITGRTVREAAAEIETSTGNMVHAFTSGAMVQVFLLVPQQKVD